jgi:Uma2 family endonuclease
MFNDTNFNAPRRYTLSEFLQRSENTDELLEYYDGKITKLPLATGLHNLILMNTGGELKNVTKKSVKKFRVFGGKQKVYLPALNFGVFLDVLVITEKPLYWDDNQVLLINPILIVEVLSKGTKKYDRTTKFAEYKTLESFQEYLLIDQKKCHVEAHHKVATDVWLGKDYKDIDDVIDLKSIGCSIALTDIYENISFEK